MESIAATFQEENELVENPIVSKKLRLRMLESIEKARKALGGDTEA